MEMTQKDLVAAGFSEQQAKAILEAHKAALAGEYVPKARFDEVNTELKSTKTTVGERDTQIAALKKFEGDAKAWQDKITELETANKQKDTEYAAALLKDRKTNAARLKLAGRVHDADLVLGQIDLEKVSVQEDGSLVGFDDQVSALQKSKAFLFCSGEGNKSKPGAGTGTGGIRIQGNEPPDGTLPETLPGGENKDMTPEQFGVRIAKAKLAQKTALDKASNSYFGIGGK